MNVRLRILKVERLLHILWHFYQKWRILTLQTTNNNQRNNFNITIANFRLATSYLDLIICWARIYYLFTFFVNSGVFLAKSLVHKINTENIYWMIFYMLSQHQEFIGILALAYIIKDLFLYRLWQFDQMWFRIAGKDV